MNTDRAAVTVSELFGSLRATRFSEVQADPLANLFNSLQVTRSVFAHDSSQPGVKRSHRTQLLNEGVIHQQQDVNLEIGTAKLSNAQCPRLARKSPCEAAKKVGHVLVGLIHARAERTLCQAPQSRIPREKLLSECVCSFGISTALRSEEHTSELQ